MRSALRVATANGVPSAPASDTAIAAISAAVKSTGGSVRALPMTDPPRRPACAQTGAPASGSASMSRSIVRVLTSYLRASRRAGRGRGATARNPSTSA